MTEIPAQNEHPLHDEILEQEARERLQEMGLDEESVEVALGEMRDGGAFNTWPD